MAESRIREITMKEIEPQWVDQFSFSLFVLPIKLKFRFFLFKPIYIFRALESLINFAYSGLVKIDNQNVQGLMVGAAFLQLNKVRDACADFLISR